MSGTELEFSLSEEQRLIQDAATGFLSANSDSKAVRAAAELETGWDKGLWERCCGEMGWQGISIPEEYGGLGMDYTTVQVVMEQTGRTLFCSPLYASLGLATNALLMASKINKENPLIAETLSALAGGESIGSLGWMTGDSASYDVAQSSLQADAGKDGYTLNGEVAHVLYGASADVLIVAARAGNDIGLFLLPAAAKGLGRTALATMDQTRPRAKLVFQDVKLDKNALIVPFEHGLAALKDTLRLAGVALAAEQTGVAAQCLDMSVGYATERTQFGRPIGTFQAIKHKCADMMVKVESMRSASWYGACEAQKFLAEGEQHAEQFAVAAATAQSYCAEHCLPCAGECIQIHGGIGFTWEYDAHLYFKRASSSQALLGDSAWHKEQLAKLLLDA